MLLYSIETKSLTKSFGDLVAVNDVSFSVEKGEIFGFLGPGYRGTILKCKKNKIGVSFSSWDANGNEFIIFAVSGARDVENRIAW